MSGAGAAFAAEPDATPSLPCTLYSQRQQWLMLALLFLVSACSYLDRHIVSVLLEPIKREFGVSDTLLGLLTGFAFVIFYVSLGVPLARWADRGDRRLVVTASLAVWSAFTVLCGFAGSFWQLALARVGVGAGEAGALPASQSLIADYFPKEKRGIALAVFMSSATVGYLVAFVGGTAIAATYGWRITLIAVGLPGLVLALFTYFFLAEPRKVLGLSRGSQAQQSIVQVFSVLWRKRSYAWVLAGAASYGIVAYGAGVFYPSFIVRSLGVSLQEVGLTYGATSAATALGAMIVGGWLADRLGRRDVRWHAWLPALSCAFSMPFLIAALLVNTYTMFLIIGGVGGIALGLGLPSMFIALHAVCGSSRRSIAVAIFTFTISLIGAGLGPLITGSLSDWFAPQFGSDSLRYSMVFCTCFLAVAAWAFYQCGRAMPQDIEV
jgi:MFS family permease